MWWFSRELRKKTDKKNQCSRDDEQIQKLERSRKLLLIEHNLETCVLGEEVVGDFRIFFGFFRGEGAWLFTKPAVTLSFYSPLFSRCKVTSGAGSQLCSFLAVNLTEAPVNGNSSKV